MGCGGVRHGSWRCPACSAIWPCECGAPAGFILARDLGEEAEVLTFGVLPEARRHGVGRALLDRCSGRRGAAGWDRSCSKWRRTTMPRAGSMPRVWVHAGRTAAALLSPAGRHRRRADPAPRHCKRSRASLKSCARIGWINATGAGNAAVCCASLFGVARFAAIGNFRISASGRKNYRVLSVLRRLHG